MLALFCCLLVCACPHMGRPPNRIGETRGRWLLFNGQPGNRAKGLLFRVAGSITIPHHAHMKGAGYVVAVTMMTVSLLAESVLPSSRVAGSLLATNWQHGGRELDANWTQFDLVRPARRDSCGCSGREYGQCAPARLSLAALAATWSAGSAQELHRIAQKKAPGSSWTLLCPGEW